MTNQHSKEDLHATFKTLPEPVRDVITSPETAEHVQEIGVKFQLHVNQIGLIADELGLMHMGLQSPQEFAQTLRTKAQLDETTINNIIRDVDAKIFSPLQQKMKEGGIAPIQTRRKPEAAAAPEPAIEHVNAFAEETANEEPEEGSGAMREPEVPVQVPVETPAPEKKIEKKYAIDPYREPIE